jgi:integrase/recombinase XerD
LSYLKERDRISLETITREDLCSFIEHEQDRGLQPTTVSTRLRLLYAFLRYLVDREVAHPDLLKRKLRVKVPEALPRAMDPEDIKQLLAVIDQSRDRAMILVLLRTGMRIGELLATRMSEVNLREKQILIKEAQKTRVGRVAYLSEDASKALY